LLGRIVLGRTSLSHSATSRCSHCDSGCREWVSALSASMAANAPATAATGGSSTDALRAADFTVASSAAPSSTPPPAKHTHAARLRQVWLYTAVLPS
jgi:hypothetical protein